MDIPIYMPALVTPFDATGDVDLAAHRHNVRYLEGEGVTGFVLAGSTGEGPYLEPGERSLLVQETRTLLPEAFLMCGINAETVRGAVSQVEEAAGAGADAALVITPTTLVRSRDLEVEGFYFDVADAASLPVYLYTVPRITGYVLPVETVARLSAHPSIVGMKDSGGEVDRIADLQDRVTEPFSMFIGASRAVADGVRAGAHGAITASGNYAWPLVHRVVDGARSNIDGIASLQSRLTELTGFIESKGLGATKAAARLAGLRPGMPRRPLLPLAGSEEPGITDALRRAGLLETEN